MKIALVHDYIKEYGGAERVLEALHEIWPDAPIYTTVYLPNSLGPHKDRLKEWKIRPSFLQLIPFRGRLISIFRLIAPFVFKSMDFSNFDVVIVSATGAYTPNNIKKGKAKHICYCHTPPRYLYGYPTARNLSNHTFVKLLSDIANHFLRMNDFDSSRNVDYFIANSKEVAGRIDKFYRKSSKVIYPPVDIPGIKPQPISKRFYYLAGGRLARAKRIDLAVKAFTEMKMPLKIFGKEFAGYGEELRKIAGPNIEFLGEVSDGVRWSLMAGAKAFIFPAQHEDFGITLVEAMAAGTPVIALKSGGVIETVEEGKTGVFFNEPSVASLSNAVKKLEKITINPESCISQAKKFSKDRFKKEIEGFIKSKVR